MPRSLTPSGPFLAACITAMISSTVDGSGRYRRPLLPGVTGIDRRRQHRHFIKGPAAWQHEDESGRAERLVCTALGATWRQAVLNAALDAVLLDFKAANAREIDRLVVWVGASAERVEVRGARPPLEDIDPGGVHRVG